MKKQLVIIAIAALALSSCGNKPQQNNTTDNENAAPIVNQETTDIDTVKSEPNYGVTLDILAEINKSHNDRFNRENIWIDPESTEKHLIFTTDDGPDGAAYHTLCLFPLNSGGDLVLFIASDVQNEYFTYIYNNGVVIKTDTNKYLPRPTFSDFYPDGCKYPKAACDIIKKKVANNPMYYVYNGQLSTTFEIWEYESGYDLPPVLEDLGEEFYMHLPQLKYQWNGEKFERVE